jgi:hypothetical protein
MLRCHPIREDIAFGPEGEGKMFESYQTPNNLTALRTGARPMPIIGLVFEGQMFHIARRSLAAPCKLLVEDRDLLKKPYEVGSRGWEAISDHFWRPSRGRGRKSGWKIQSILSR